MECSMSDTVLAALVTTAGSVIIAILNRKKK
jgi:hypothetical protein